MLAVLTVAVLASAVVLGLVTSSENILAVLLAGVGTIVLFPAALLVVGLDISAPFLSESVPAVENWQSTFAELTAGAYGFDGWQYLVAAVPLWVAVVVLFGDADGTGEGSTGTPTRETSTTTTADGQSRDSAETVTDSASSRGGDTPGVDSPSGHATGELRPDSLVSLNSVGTEQEVALELKNAGYTDVDDLRAADRQELADVGGIGMALADRIKAEVGDSQQSAGEERSTEAKQSTGEERSTEERSTEAKQSTEERSTEAKQSTDERQSSDSENTRNPQGGQIDLSGPETETSFPDDGKSETEARDTAEQPSQSILSEYQGDELTEVECLERFERGALVKAGYTTVDGLRTVSVSELAEAVGHGTAIEIRREVGYVDVDAGASDGDDQRKNDTGTESGQGGRADGEDERPPSLKEVAETVHSEDEGVEPAEDETDEQFQSLQDNVRSLMDAATTEPLANLAGTESRLVRAHAKAVALAESAPDQDTRERAQEQLEKIESRLDVVPDLVDALETARSRVPPEEGPSEDSQTELLERARDGYDTAIEVAERGGFPTDRLEREREAITAELARRESSETSPAGAEDESDTEDDDAPPREALVEELQRLDGETEGCPLTTELGDTGEYDPGQYYDRFESWEDALEAAGIDKEQRLVADIRRVAELVDGPPSTVEMNEHGVHSSGTHSNYFGTWAAAVEAAGLDREKAGPDDEPLSSETDAEAKQADESGEPTNAAYVEAIQQVAESTDRVVKSTDVSEQSPYSAHEIINALGSWQDALKAAGVDNEARLLQELRRVGEEMGHPPTTTEMNEHGHVSATMYADYFGSFTDARERAYWESSPGREPEWDGDSEPEPGGSSTEVHRRDSSDPTDEQSPVSRINSGDLLSEDTTETADPFATVADVTEDSRLDRNIAVSVREVLEEGGDRKQARLLVEDLDGEQCRLNVWRTHDIDVTWQVGHWYVLEEVRGKVWTTKRGETERRLSSTGDLLVSHAGTDRPSKEDAADDPDSTDNTSPTSEPTDKPAADETESETILSEVVNEFEDLSDMEDS